jgi:hypothetical protein
MQAERRLRAGGHPARLPEAAAQQHITLLTGQVADLALSLEDDGELVIINHSRTRFDPVKRYEVATSATWAQPTLSGERLFVRDVSSLTLLVLE